MTAVWVAWFLIGCVVGSFLNVCIYRMPREQSIVHPRSRCPHCAHPIAWYDNVPLLSFLDLRGRCRHCQHPIHWRYPVVEALSGVAAVVVLHRVGTGPVGLIYLCFVWALLVASVIDLDFQIIPDEISLGGLVVGLAVSPLVPQLHGTTHAWLSLMRAGMGAFVGGGLIYTTGLAGDLMLVGLRRLGIRLRRNPYWRAKLAKYRHMKEAIGGGDVKLLAMAGSLMGWKLITVTFFLAPLLAVIPGLVVLVTRRSHIIPYGPFLSLAMVVSLFAGNRLLQVTGIEESVRVLWSFYGWAH